MADFLTILSNVADELGLTRPSAVTAIDQQTRQLVALANRDGAELMKAVDWTALQAEYIIEIGSPTALTGTLTANSRVVTAISSTAGLTTAYAVSGTGLLQSSRIASVDSATQVTLNQAATASGTVSLTFTKDTFALPSDMDRYITQTQWDRRFHWELVGPMSPQSDQWQRSGITALGPRRRFRQIGRGVTAFRIFPPPSAASEAPGTLVFEYISNGWVTKAAGTTASALTADDDQVIFPAGLLELGVKWRFFQSKGFAYSDLQSEYIDWVNREKARDGGNAPLNLSRRSNGRYLIGSDNIQDSNFPDRSGL